MILIPGPCGEPVLPEECQDGLFQLASCLVEAGVSAISGFLPDEEALCGPFTAFVAFGAQPQPADLCNQLTVQMQSIQVIPATHTCARRWRMPFLMQSWFSVYPIVEPLDDGEFAPPSPEDQEAANRWLYAVGVALVNGVVTALDDFTCGSLRIASRGIGTVTPLGPSGGCAGWSLPITVDV